MKGSTKKLIYVILGCITILTIALMIITAITRTPKNQSATQQLTSVEQNSSIVGNESFQEKTADYLKKSIPKIIILSALFITWGIVRQKAKRRFENISESIYRTIAWCSMTSLGFVVLLGLLFFKLWLVAILLLILGGASAFILYPYCFWAFATIEEAYGIVVVRGKSYVRQIINYAGHKINENGKIVEWPEDPRLAPGFEAEDASLLKQIKIITVGWVTGSIKPGDRILPGGGWFRIGWAWDKVLEKEFTWYSIVQSSDGEISVKYHEKEPLRQFYLGDKLYPIPVKNADDKNRLPLNVLPTFLAKVIDLSRAIFANQDYMETMQSFMRAIITDEVKSEVAFTDKTISTVDFMRFIFDKHSERIEQNKETLGISIAQDIRIEQMDPATQDGKDDVRKISQTAIEKRTSETEAETSVFKSTKEFYEKFGAIATGLAISLGVKPEELPVYIQHLKKVKEAALAANIDLDKIAGLDEKHPSLRRISKLLGEKINKAQLLDIKKELDTIQDKLDIKETQRDLEMAERGARIEIDAGDSDLMHFLGSIFGLARVPFPTPGTGTSTKDNTKKADTRNEGAEEESDDRTQEEILKSLRELD